jgi:hypothetical protein
MKWRCPQPGKARQMGCLNLTDDGQCIRKEWLGMTYFKEKSLGPAARAEVYCERIRASLREI